MAQVDRRTDLIGEGHSRGEEHTVGPAKSDLPSPVEEDIEWPSLALGWSVIVLSILLPTLLMGTRPLLLDPLQLAVELRALER